MSALDELKSMIREKGGNTNVSSLAEALREYNKYDDVSGGGIFPVNLVAGEDENRHTDKTWNEIKASFDRGLLPVLVIDTSADCIVKNPTARNVDSHEVDPVSRIETFSTDDGPRYEVCFYGYDTYTLQSTDADVPMVLV